MRNTSWSSARIKQGENHMEHAAACLYGAKSAFSPVLWKPALFWVADAVRAAGLDAGVLPENDDAAKAAAAKLPVWDAAALAGACAGAKDLLLLRGDLALVGADSIRAAYDAHKANQNDLTAFCCPDTGDAPAAWVRTAALPAALPTEPGFPLPALLLQLQAAGARIQRLAASVASAALCADTAGNRHLLTEAARRQILDALLDAGVEIPAWLNTSAEGVMTYICKGGDTPFCFADLIDLGSVAAGLSVRNPQLYRLDHAPICRGCDAYHCKRCIWLNRRATLEVNTPGHRQCVMAHIERNVSAQLLAAIREKQPGFLPGRELGVTDCLDPFDKLKEL